MSPLTYAYRAMNLVDDMKEIFNNSHTFKYDTIQILNVQEKNILMVIKFSKGIDLLTDLHGTNSKQPSSSLVFSWLLC